MSVGTKIAEAFNWAAKVPERPFTIVDEFNRVAGNPEYGGYKFGRAARVVDRVILVAGILALATGTSLTLLGLAPAYTATAGGVVMAAAIVKGVSTAAAALTEGVVKVGKALTDRTVANKVGAGPASPTPKP